MFPILVVSQTNKESVPGENIFTMFYNVENLFDTINNTTTIDDEFLPISEKKCSKLVENHYFGGERGIRTLGTL